MLCQTNSNISTNIKSNGCTIGFTIDKYSTDRTANYGHTDIGSIGVTVKFSKWSADCITGGELVS
jgi:hypothetical protein